jgi:hypothetical protein
MLEFMIIYGFVKLICVWIILYAYEYEFHMKNDGDQLTSD